MNGSRVFAPALVLLALTAASRPAAAAWPHDPYIGNVALCTAAGNQYKPTSVSDGAGGAIVTWYDLRSGANYHIYAQRISAAGVPQWTANGVAVCAVTGDQQNPTIVSDGSGGAIITWWGSRTGSDDDIYAQRISAGGVPQWTANGVALCTATSLQSYPTIVSDGSGGAIVTWQDYRSGNEDVYAQRIDAAGAPQWTANGEAVCTATGDQAVPTIASDGASGAIVTWFDPRSGNNDIYAQRVDKAGAPRWTVNGVALCTATGSQTFPTITSDGAGGAIATWQDFSGASPGIYAQHIGAAGSVQWTANGVALCVPMGSQGYPAIMPDDAGGAIVTWFDYRNGTNSDIYAQRISAAGAPQWTANGVALCTAASEQFYPTIVSDGSGGAIVTWHDYRTFTWDVYAQRISAAGVPQWTANGVALCTAVSDQVNPTIIPDGGGGAIVVWQDVRGGTWDVYAQRVDSFGYLGSPEPASAGVRDVPNDQGGKLKVSWSASYLDGAPYSLIDSYWILRSAPPNVVAQARATGARTSADLSIEPEAGVRTFLALPNQAAGYAWEFIASQPAFHVSNYSYVAPSTSDSVGAGNPRTAFMIMARTLGGYQWWFSSPDSGYSVDNLPPVIPAPFTGQYAAGTTRLHWNPNTEGDLAGYRLYRGSSVSFTPGSANLVGALPDTGYADAAGAPYVYKLTASDAHGNQSPVATLIPSGALGVGDAAPTALSFAAPSPNPARGATTLDYTLSRAGHVRLAVYDAAGRRVQLLRAGELTAGAHRESFVLRDEAGRDLASGLYLVRLEAEGRVLTRRLAAIR